MAQYKLSDLFTLQMGKTPARAKDEYWNNGDNEWVSIGDLSSFDKYTERTKETISDKAVQESGIKIVPKNTVIMSFKLSLGKTCITTQPIYTNEAIMAFIPKSNNTITTDFLYYYLSSIDWNKSGNRAVMGTTLNKATLSNIIIDVPQIQIQNDISSKLDKLTDLINKRKQQLQKLDELVKARFVEMFGDPKYNIFNFNTMPIPRFCEIIDGDRGKNYPKQEDFLSKGFCLFLNAKNVTSRGFNFENCVFITKKKDSQLNKGKLIRGDVILTTRGTIGNLALYTDKVPFEHVRINSGMVILRMKHELINDIFFIEQFKILLNDIKEKNASGSAQPQLPISTMNKIEMLLPDLPSQNQFAKFVEYIKQIRSEIEKSIVKLELLKKSLMQEYFG